MFDALYIGATGMQAQQLNVDTIANNLANLNTPGFKKARVSFTDLMTIQAAQQSAQQSGSAAGLDSSADAGPLGSVPLAGAGVGVANLSKLFDLGSMSSTGSPMDIAIQGDGFLQVSLPDGSDGYTRGGSLKVNSDGLLTTQGGQPLKPGITIPSNATSVTIGADGTVTATVPGQTKPVDAGKLQLVRFSNPTGLTAQGDNLYRSSTSSGEPIAGSAGQDGIGSLQQGYLEGSNVKLVDEMINLTTAQRAYQASAKVMQASDDMLGIVNNLRK